MNPAARPAHRHAGATDPAPAALLRQRRSLLKKAPQQVKRSVWGLPEHSMPHPVQDLHTHRRSGQRIGQPLRADCRRDRIVTAGKDQRRALDGRGERGHVHRTAPALPEMALHVLVDPRASTAHLHVSTIRAIQRQRVLPPRRRCLRTGIPIQKPGRRLPRDRAAAPLEHVQAFREARRRTQRAVQHQPGHQLREPRRADHPDKPTARSAYQHHTPQTDHRAKLRHVIGPPLPRPPARIAPIRAPRATLVQIDHLRDIAHRRELRLEQAMVTARAAMQQHQRRPLLHHLALSDQPGPFHIEVQSDTIHDHPHPHILPDTRSRHRSCAPGAGRQWPMSSVTRRDRYRNTGDHHDAQRIPDVTPSRIATRGPAHTASADRSRTLAWFIARQPGGAIAGAIHYRHLSVQMFEGYAGTSDSGFRAEVESEQALARGEHLLAMIDAHEHTDLRGPAAPEAAQRLEDFAGHARFHGMVVTDERRLLRLMRREDPAVYPGTYVTCVFDPTKALCRRSSADHPDLGACRPLDCRNVALTPVNAATWHTEIAHISQQLSRRPPLPPLLHHQLSDRLGELTKFLDRNHEGRTS
jgi:hypothetical protein